MVIGTTVVIPVRNGSNFLAEAVESALAQLGRGDEVLVIWDDSDDNTVTVAATFQDRRIRAIKGPGLGVSGGRNTGLAEASGEFVAFLDHDDLWPAGRHFKMRQVLENDPEVDAVFGRTRIRLDPGATPWQWVLDLDGRHILGPNLGSALFRRRFLRSIGGFDESLCFGEDVDYFLRLQEAGMRISLCDADALIYRRHSSNCTDDQLAVNNSIFDVLKRRANRVSASAARKRG